MTRILSALSAIALGLSLSIAVPVAVSAAPGSQTVTINTSSSFSPAEITVKASQPVTLKFVGSGVHGIESKELGIPATTITPGSGKTVTFTPSAAGTYTLHCTVMCGPDHAKMALVIKVVA